MGDFVLDTSRLAGLDLAFEETVIEDRGRLIQLDWQVSGASQDLELYGYAIRAFGTEAMAMAGQTNAFAAADFAYIETIIEDRGRGIQLDWQLGGANQDMEILGYAVRLVPTEGHSMDQS